MTKDALRSWEQLAKATVYILDHPNTPQGMFHAIERFADAILPPDENVGAHYGRRILAMGRSLAGRQEKPRQAHPDEIYEDWCQEFGDMLSAILGYDHTPEVVKTAAAELCATVEDWARREKSFAYSKARVRVILPELMILASYFDIDSEEMYPAGDVAAQSEAVM